MKRAAKELKEQAARIPRSFAALVALSFALPSDFKPLRMRNEYSTEETALFNVFEEHKPWGLPGTNEQLRDDTHVEFIFQDMLRNRVSYVRNLGNVLWSYVWIYSRSNVGGDVNFFTVAAFSTETAYPSHATTTALFRPHGDVLFAESDEQYSGMWIDAGPVTPSNLNITLAAVPSATTGRIVVLVYLRGAWTELTSTNITIAVVSYNISITLTGIYTVRVEGATNAQNVTVTSSGTCGCWGHFPAPYFVVNGNTIESCRALGHSILVKNTAAPLNQQGFITGVQPGKGRYWTNFITTDGSSDIFPVVRDYAGAENTRPLATGLYGFVKPTEEEDLRFRTPFTISNFSGNIGTVWTMARTPILKTEYVVVVMQCTTAAGRDILVRTDQSGEFETGNQFFMTDKPREEPADWRDGMEALASFTQFYENPAHWKKIISTIGSIASVGGRILSLFGPKGSAVGVPLSIAGDIAKGI